MLVLKPLEHCLVACSGGSGTDDTAVIEAKISEVQGKGAASPLEGATVRISGVVSGDFQDNDTDKRSNLGGFFLQSINPDADPATSEGVFVFDGNSPDVDVIIVPFTGVTVLLPSDSLNEIPNEPE